MKKGKGESKNFPKPRARTDEEIPQQTKFLETVLESLAHPFYVIDANDYTIKIANSAAHQGRITGPTTCYALTHKTNEPCGGEEHPCPLEIIRQTKKPVIVEHTHYDKDGDTRNVEVHGFPVFDSEGTVVQVIEYCLDITERKEAEKHQLLARKILERINQKSKTREVIREILELIEQYTGFDAVGIRLREGDDFPYFAFRGFPKQFVEAENYLCARNEQGQPLYDSEGNILLECVCGHVINGRGDPTLPVFTEAGTFWTNSTTELLRSTLLKDMRISVRGRCNEAGYESVALIPLRCGQEIVGLLQLNDKRPGCFTRRLMNFFEGIGASIGIALARIKAEEQIRELNEELEQRVAERTAELTEANKQLRQEIERRKRLEKEILSISSREQTRLGQELHDSLGQQLAGIAIMAKLLEHKLNSKSLAESVDAGEIVKLVNEAIGQTRNLARGLHPVDLDASGLMSALQKLAVTTEQLFGVRCTFNCDEPVPINDATAAEHLYRIAQEAVTNAIRHGEAGNIWIALALNNDNAVLTVENDGRNFPKVPPKKKGMGLQIMNYRAEMVDGSLKVRRGAKGGTVVTCIFPNKKRNRGGKKSYDHRKTAS